MTKDLPPLYLTVDLEDQTEAYELNGRYVAMTYRLINLFRERNRRATFFSVGRIAKAAPDLLREIVAAGHSIGYHSHDHLALTEESPEIFKRETADDKDRIEQVTGKKLIGYRAPCFSLTPKSRWVIENLAELGFAYSSSIMPTCLSRFGFPGAPRSPFRWGNGLVEFPLPLVGPKKMGIPFSGGIYLYLSPSGLNRSFWNKQDQDAVCWTYMHPYDFDGERPKGDMPNTPKWVDVLLRIAGKRAPARVNALFDFMPATKLTLDDLALDKGFVSRLPEKS